MVTKAYRGPDAHARCAREVTALEAVAGLLPVPPIISAGRTSLQTVLVPGVHGQDLIAAGLADAVLAACGRMLRQIHDLPVPAGLAGDPEGPAGQGEVGSVLVHGDFGPNNVLLDRDARSVTAVLDWEWAHAGDALEDLAWCEFIIRLHHPAEVAALDGFYAAYGSRPEWEQTHQTIMQRCEWMLGLCQRWSPGGSGARAWAERVEIVGSWTA